jgi:UDP-N-acetylmuramoyl-L-alanyl-D-glutamate--2,6-diaminopimelate ligase
MHLSDLCKGLPVWCQIQRGDPEITNVAADSRKMEPGSLFVAVKGVDVDGHRFIPQAVERGAAAVVFSDPQWDAAFSEWPQVAAVRVPDSREALAWISAAWHGYPARSLKMIGVTGTDGKTTTVNLIASILSAAGFATSLISTVNARIGNQEYDTGLHTTTPDAPDVQRYLAQTVAAGSQYAVLEATSHGLAQHRVAACEFDVAVVTNITHEHLDYHGSYEAYRAAKARLFTGLMESHRKPDTPKVAVLNADDSSFEFLRAISADIRLVYGLHDGTDLTAKDVRHTPQGLEFRALTPVGEVALRSRLVGLYNVHNILAAASVAVSQGIDLKAIQQGVANLGGIKGRMERIDEGQDFTAIVDFAHTPNALATVLREAHQIASGRVIVVFGSAGLRDQQKRGLMGHAAGQLADRIVITAEDPRTEDLNQIMEQIAQACRAEGCEDGRDFWKIGDRAEAIGFAVDMAESGDVVIAAGKGHEQSMCFGTVEYPWSDHETLRNALRRRSRHHPATRRNLR